MTLDDLTVSFRHLNRETLLDDWRWLIGPACLPILVSAAGDAFIQDATDGSVHILDVAVAKVGLVASSVSEFQILLRDRDFVGEYFAVNLVGELRARGLVLGHGQIYSFVKPPILGGEQELENIEISDIEVHFSISGQIARQVSEVPVGTQVNRVSISKEQPARPWWKFW